MSVVQMEALRARCQESFPPPQMIDSVWQCIDHRSTGKSLCWDDQAGHLYIMLNNRGASTLPCGMQLFCLRQLLHLPTRSAQNRLFDIACSGSVM